MRLLKQPFKALKRTFDIIFSAIGILLLWWLIAISWVVASVDTKKNGFFRQTRVGLNGKTFKVVKIRTMREVPSVLTTVTTKNDIRITKSGRFFRATKVDELPQLFNILIGDMSFVGPRPDVPGFADCLDWPDSQILKIRPGITGPATLKYKNEEEILSTVEDPVTYNRDIIFPDKVKINLRYIEEWSLTKDLFYIWRTIFY